MTDKTTPESPSAEVVAPAAAEQNINDSPGRLIRQARERVQMSLDELAAQTKLPRSVLDALERDDFNILREPVYVRGYYRKCCKSLKLSEETLIAAYQRLVGKAAPSSPSKLLLVPDNEMFGPSGGGSMRWWLVLIVVVAVLVVIYSYLHNRSTALPTPPLPTVHSSTTAVSPAASVAPAAVAAPASDSSANTMQPDAGQTGMSSTPTTESPADETTQPKVATAPAAVSSKSLILSFNQTSWVRIEDSTGKILLTGVIQAGQRQEMTGTPPYSVFLGNALGVTVEYAGNTVSVKPYLKSNSTARFSVPQG